MTPSYAMTVVVPTRDSARTLAACLDSILAQSLKDIQLVVVDNGSTDDTVQVASSRANAVLEAGPERSAQRNVGWRAEPHSETVAFIDSDMVLEPHVLEEAANALAQNDRLGGVIVTERSFGEGFFSKCRVLEKQLYTGDERVEAARVIRRAVLEEIGGYNEALTAFEDWDLHDRILSTGYGVGRTTSTIWHDEGRLSLIAAFRKKRYYGRWLHIARANGALNRPLVNRIFVKHPWLLLRFPHYAAGLFLLKSVECVGMLLGSESARRENAP